MRKEQILTEATRLIAQSGYNAVSLATVAHACDVRKQSILHYFPTMPDLLRAVLQRRDLTVFEEAVGSTFPEPDPQSCRDAMTRIFELHLLKPELMRLAKVVSVEALDPHHPGHQWAVSTHRASIDSLVEALAWKDAPGVAAVQLLGFWEGLELLGLRDPALEVRAAWESFCDDFFPGTSRTPSLSGAV